VATLPGLPSRTASRAEHHGVLTGLRNGALMRPATVFATSAAAAGVVVTFLPLALVGGPVWAAPVALLLQPAAATLGRWCAGRLGDRRGQAGLLVPGLLMSISGTAAMAVTGAPFLVLAGAALFGAGFGVLQNASLSLMYARVPTSGFSAVSAIWNAGYDFGMAVGAIGVAALVSGVGYGASFLVTAAVMVPAVLVARHESAGEPDRTRAPEVDLPPVAVAA
jgi:predicted MFS family arabinose efflux permease